MGELFNSIAAGYLITVFMYYASMNLTIWLTQDDRLKGVSAVVTGFLPLINILMTILFFHHIISYFLGNND